MRTLEREPEAFEDLRELEPPEPLERIFAALATASDAPLAFMLLREPVFLYPILQRARFEFTVNHEEDGVRLVIRRRRIP